jgi:hypothetical protein
MKNKIKELREVLDKISGILDGAYENAEDKEEKNYINKTECELYALLGSLLPDLYL